jgi:hypothetical protein
MAVFFASVGFWNFVDFRNSGISWNVGSRNFPLCARQSVQNSVKLRSTGPYQLRTELLNAGSAKSE